MLGISLAGIGLRVDCLNTHFLHESLDTLSIYSIVHTLQGICDASAAQERTVCMDDIDQTPNLRLFFTGLCRFVINARSTQVQQAALTHD